MNYYRNFITLASEGNRRRNGREPSGRCVIEVKNKEGRVMCYAQDLLPNTRYSLYLISGNPVDSDKSSAVCAGSFYSEANGKCEVLFEFENQNAFASGFSIDRFNAIAISMNEFDVVLIGFKNNIKFTWRVNLEFLPKKEVMQEEKQEEIHIPEAEAEPEPKPEPKPEPEPVQEPEAPAFETNSHEYFKILARRFNEEMRALSKITFENYTEKKD